MTEQRKSQLFDNMLRYIGEKNDLVDTLRAIGFTEEIADLVKRSIWESLYLVLTVRPERVRLPV